MVLPNIYQFLRALTFYFDPEIAHRVAIKILQTGLVFNQKPFADPILETTIWGKKFKNPIGLAAGFDKNAEIVLPMLAMGFGFVEAGSVTPKSQVGNIKPRLFRLVENRAIINRMGFNNDGHEKICTRLQQLKNNGCQGPIGINLGYNKGSSDPLQEYVDGIKKFATCADYFVVNVSSPNTVGLRALQKKELLSHLLHRVKDAIANINTRPSAPILIKVAPDLSDRDVYNISDAILEYEIDGLIATNTTIKRPPSLKGNFCAEKGGLSGEPLFVQSTQILAKFFELTHGKVPLIGVGGVLSGADAYAKIKAGASLVQLYTAMIYEGPGIVRKINLELANLLRADGYKHISDAVGVG